MFLSLMNDVHFTLNKLHRTQFQDMVSIQIEPWTFVLYFNIMFIFISAVENFTDTDPNDSLRKKEEIIRK